MLVCCFGCFVYTTANQAGGGARTGSTLRHATGPHAVHSAGQATIMTWQIIAFIAFVPGLPRFLGWGWQRSLRSHQTGSSIRRAVCLSLLFLDLLGAAVPLAVALLLSTAPTNTKERRPRISALPSVHVGNAAPACDSWQICCWLRAPAVLGATGRSWKLRSPFVARRPSQSEASWPGSTRSVCP